MHVPIMQATTKLHAPAYRAQRSGTIKTSASGIAVSSTAAMIARIGATSSKRQARPSPNEAVILTEIERGVVDQYQERVSEGRSVAARAVSRMVGQLAAPGNPRAATTASFRDAPAEPAAGRGIGNADPARPWASRACWRIPCVGLRSRNPDAHGPLPFARHLASRRRRQLDGSIVRLEKNRMGERVLDELILRNALALALGANRCDADEDAEADKYEHEQHEPTHSTDGSGAGLSDWVAAGTAAARRMNHVATTQLASDFIVISRFN